MAGTVEQIVECVMNVSEGQDGETLQSVAQEISKTEGTFLLDMDPDPDHHRTVFSFIGTPVSILQAAFSAACKAIERIDLRLHRGAHPRIGAVDVIPFVPVRAVCMGDCVRIARQLGRRIGEELQIPVYLYAHAAGRAERRELATLRRGEFEGLTSAISTDATREPDFGPKQLHPSAGAMLIGARPVLIAFNIFLNTRDVSIARRVARVVRESGGGLPGVKALGFYIDHKRLAQVSMNVTEYKRTSLRTVFDAVEKEANRWGARPVSSEIVGLVPREALSQTSIEELKLTDFRAGQILENRIAEVLGEKGR